MRRLSFGLILLLGFLVATTVAADKSPFAGIWDGKQDNSREVPGVTLTITDTGGKLSGSMLMYKEYPGADGKMHVARKLTFPMRLLRAEGKLLTWEITPPRTSTVKSIKYSLEITGPEVGILLRTEQTFGGSWEVFRRQAPAKSKP